MDNDQPQVHRFSRWGMGAAAGLVSALAGLAVAELVSATRQQLQSPVLDVGDRVIDSVPNSIKTLAIDWFGTNDKIALLIGIGSLLAVYALVMGVLAVSRRWTYALIGVGLFGLVGAYASQTTRRAAPWWAVVPSLVGGVVAMATLWFLRKQLVRPVATPMVDTPTLNTPTDVDIDESDAELIELEPIAPTGVGTELDRRKFVVSAAATAAGAVVVGTVGRKLGTRSSVGAQRTELGVPVARQPLAEIPAGVAAPVDGVSPFFTPNADFYRIDTALTVPQVSVESWQLRIKGLVDRELTISYDELLSRPIIERDITLTCVSNEVGGKLLGTARWVGVRLDDLLAEAGIDPSADQIVGRSVDGYTCGFPVAALDGRDAMIAVGMNDEPLPLEHGYPARLIVPGLYGYVSATKWLTEIELTRFDDFDQYWVERGWVEEAPIKVQSRIDTPKGLSKQPAGTLAIAGVAWAQTRGIDRVEVQIDDGDWQEATLADELNDVTWRQWSLAWEATSGRHTLRVRATERTKDGSGAIQTDERSEPFPSGATGQHQVVVLID